MVGTTGEREGCPMKKKYLKPAIMILLCAVALALLWNLSDRGTLQAKGQRTELSFIDSWRLRFSLMSKQTEKPAHECGFGQDYSVEMGGLTYCFAQDDCSTVYIPELDLTYTIADHKHNTLHRVLSKYEPEGF